MQCRTSADCAWLDNNLACEDYEVKFTPISKLWFGGDWASIRGECNCQAGLLWNGNELSCEQVSVCKNA